MDFPLRLDSEDYASPNRDISQSIEYAHLREQDEPLPISMPPAENANCSPDYLFEPIYRREDSLYVPAGHKSVIRLGEEADPMAAPMSSSIDESTQALVHALHNGISQIAVIENQINRFIEYRMLQAQQKLVFEINLADIDENPATLVRIAHLIKRAEADGLRPTDFVVELSCNVDIDRGILYTITAELKRMGVMIALTNLDADSFSFTRVLQIQPDVIKFNRSWCEQDLNDPAYIRMVHGLVAGFHDRGRFTNLSGIATWEELLFASKCGFTRCQGPFFGKPVAELERGPTYCIRSRRALIQVA